jgi:hypothetical protein
LEKHVFASPQGQGREAQEEKRKFAVEEGDHITYLNGILLFSVLYRANTHYQINVQYIKDSSRTKGASHGVLNTF